MGPSKVTSRLLVSSHKAPSDSRIVGFRKCGSLVNVKFAEGQRGRHRSAILAVGKRPAGELWCMRKERSEKRGKCNEEEKT